MYQPTTHTVRSISLDGDAPAGRRRSVWLGILAVVAALLTVAAGTNLALQHRDQQRFPPPGELVELSDGRRFHLHVSGADGGGPTVILDGGHGAFSPVFGHIQQTLSESVQVVSYDRPGYGWSDPAGNDHEALAVAGDLREALTAAAIDGPFIVVGHSLGGLYARRFAHSYADEITGLVLIDPAHENQLDRLPDEVVAQMACLAGWAGR